ncbi:type I-E CRISPR-associated protein Cas6/Cse3/CasE [Fontivita pretiosa]|uniref:type I-E CRISPR-associated protein Cas6/Cse3/CasE n=1 Tax=Fontivita pretiosa TaxID=2989684 RepID=UPI003D16C80B
MNDRPPLYISAIRVPADSEFAATAWWDYYRLHQLVCRGFADRRALAEARVLFRCDIEGDWAFLYVQSRTKPDWSKLEPPLSDCVAGPTELQLPSLQPGLRLRFRLLARPSVRIGEKSSPDRGRRLTLEREPEQRQWLQRKGMIHGFEVHTCTLTDRIWHDTRAGHTLPNGQLLPLHAVLFDGVLSVVDPDKLWHAIRNGIGPQKAFGFGLLSVAPLA